MYNKEKKSCGGELQSQKKNKTKGKLQQRTNLGLVTHAYNSRDGEVEATLTGAH